MEIYHYLAITISLISLGISIYTYKKTYKLNLQSSNLNVRKSISEQFDEYSTLLHSEYCKLNEDLSKFSTILSCSNTVIGNVLDKYDSRSSNTSKNYQKCLRHIYCDLYRDITASFKYELSWQTTENIYYRLSVIRDLRTTDLNTTTAYWQNLFQSNTNTNQYPESTLIESEGFIKSFVELTESIDESKYKNLYNETVNACGELKEFLKDIKPRCKESYDLLESGVIKNNLQEFKLWEYSPLYTRYRQFQRLLKLIDQSRLCSLNIVEDTPHLTLSQIVYFGANIDMINNLLCSTLCGFRE
jgi:hypothetical protein